MNIKFFTGLTLFLMVSLSTAVRAETESMERPGGIKGLIAKFEKESQAEKPKTVPIRVTNLEALKKIVQPSATYIVVMAKDFSGLKKAVFSYKDLPKILRENPQEVTGQDILDGYFDQVVSEGQVIYSVERVIK